MNNAKIWLVVPPAVGVPVFLGAVAVGSFAVHVAVVSNTSWVSDFLSGQELGTGDATAAAEALENQNVGQASYVVPSAGGGQEVLIRMPDGTMTTAILQEPSLYKASAPPTVVEQ